MADDFINIEGFEKYGPVPNGATFFSVTAGNFWLVNSSATQLLNQGYLQEWTNYSNPANARNQGLITGLNGTGVALLMVGSSNGTTTTQRTLSNSYSRLIVGFAFMTNLSGITAFAITDSGSTQVSIGTNTSGQIVFYRGFQSTLLFTSTQIITSNSRHYLEIDVTIHPSAGHYQIWLDGVSIKNSDNLQNTRSTANSTANGFILSPGGTDSCKMAFDDIYVRDNTTGTASPCGDVNVVTLPVTSDSSVQFSPAATMIGPWHAQQVFASNAPGANFLALVPVTPTVNCTLNSISIYPQATSAGVKNKGVVYSDSSGNPGSLLSDGTEVVGTTVSVTTTLPLVTPQSLTGGTQYWIGYYTDTSVVIWNSDQWHVSGQKKANTYGSGAPAGPLSGMTTGQNPWCIWGNATGAGTNYQNLTHIPPPLEANLGYEYNSDSVIGHEDLFNVTDLSITPTTIYTVKVSCLAAKSQAGTKTFTQQVKSGTTDQAGASISPSTTFTFYQDIFSTDPDTPSVAWTASGVNGMKVGYKVAT